MSIFIGIEDLAANALIELINRDVRDEVSFEELTQYGLKVVEILKNEGENAILFFSRDITNALERDYSMFFKVFTKDEKQYIKLKENIKTEDVVKRYRSYITINQLLAYISEESLKTIGVS